MVTDIERPSFSKNLDPPLEEIKYKYDFSKDLA